VLLPIYYFIQEMVARLGIATGKGHAAMIYERFGKWWGRFSLLDLLAVNFLTLITEFAAISLALGALGISPYISVPVSAVGLTLMVVTGSYLRWERIVIALCLMDLTWFVVAFLVHPHWATVAHNSIVPTMPAGGISSKAVVSNQHHRAGDTDGKGCTDKGIQPRPLQVGEAEPLLGHATLLEEELPGRDGRTDDGYYKEHKTEHKVVFQDPAQLALALGPIAGNFVRMASCY
jgi:Natural resistance-associated macrophage protein